MVGKGLLLLGGAALLVGLSAVAGKNGNGASNGTSSGDVTGGAMVDEAKDAGVLDNTRVTINKEQKAVLDSLTGGKVSADMLSSSPITYGNSKISVRADGTIVVTSAVLDGKNVLGLTPKDVGAATSLVEIRPSGNAVNVFHQGGFTDLGEKLSGGTALAQQKAQQAGEQAAYGTRTSTSRKSSTAPSGIEFVTAGAEKAETIASAAKKGDWGAVAEAQASSTSKYESNPDKYKKVQVDGKDVWVEK